MRTSVALAVGFVAASVAAARADDTKPTWVRAELAGAKARLVAHYELEVDAGMQQDLAVLDLPNDGIATGAVVSADGVTRRLALVPAEVAQQQIDELLQGEAGDDRPWIVRLAASGHAVVVDVAAATSSHLALDVEIEAATCFFHDARFVAVPPAWTGALDPALAAAPRGEGFPSVCGEATTWLAFGDRALARRTAGADRIGTVTARLPLATEDLASVEVAIAGELGAVPADLHTAIVVDASRSLTGRRTRAQRAIVAAYLRAAPHGQVQVVEYARGAHALLPEWADATAAAPAIDRALDELRPSNGSNVDAGLAEAATWLARVRGTRRIIVLTDELVPHRLAALDQSALAASLPDHTLVNVVALDDRSYVDLQRDDDVLFAPLAAATFGMATHASTDDQLTADATMLARPTSLDHVDISGSGWSQRSFPCANTSIVEGTSCTWNASGDASAGGVVISGDIWGRHVERALELDGGAARALARTLSASRPYEDGEQAEIDRAAEGVNDVWSLFARWGGDDSYGEQGGTGIGFGLGSIGGTSHCGGASVVTAVSTLDLRVQLAPVLARCGATRAHVALDLELTLDEIVDVTATVTGDGATPALHDCIVEATWQTLLAVPHATEHQTVHVDLR